MSAAAGPVPELIAHRAGNDLDTLRRLEPVADLLEVDVHRFRGRLEVRHAKVLWPTGRLWERWEVLRRGAPRPALDHVLAAAAPSTHLLLDLKGVSPRVAGAVRDALGERRPVTVSTKPWWLLRSFRGTGVRTIRSVGNRFELFLLLWLPVGRRGVDGVGVHQRLLSRTLVSKLRRRVDVVYCWDVVDRRRADELTSWGVTGLIVDDEDLLTDLRRRWATT